MWLFSIILKLETFYLVDEFFLSEVELESMGSPYSGVDMTSLYMALSDIYTEITGAVDEDVPLLRPVFTFFLAVCIQSDT